MKRNIYLLFAALLTAFSLQAQVVQTTPEFPTLDQSLTIRFFANLGNGGLNNCNCDVFLHIGLITIESTDNSDWQNVPTEWGVELPDFKMTRTGANSYQYNIDDIRAFFEVSDSVEIRQIAILFRDAAGNRVGRDSDGGDFFIDIFDNSAGVFAVLNAPLIELQVFEPGDSIEFEVSANKEVAWTFIRNEEVIFESSSNSNQIDYTYFVTETESGLQAMTILAEDADGAFRDSVVYQYLVKVKTNIATVPSGLKAGITRGENGKVSFVLVAPNKGDVYLDGSRSANWPGDDLIQMNRTPDGERYWVEIEGFEENEWYVYTYLLPGELRIADPFSELIINGSEDRFIPENVNTYFPNPGNTEFENLSAFKYEGFPYEWQVTDFEAVPVEEMFVYELLVRDMFEERSYQNLIDTLDYLERLGVNAIELMPVNEFEGNESWGYNPSFHMALDKYYGDPITFKAFIDEAHKRGMAVIVDIVLNHAFGQSPLNRLYWDAANFRPTAENPWLNPIARHPFNVGYDFNHESTYTKEFSQRITQYWLEEFKIDGYRFDLSKGFTQKQSSDDGVFRQYDASRIAILNEMADYCRVVNPNAILILEHFGANNEETELSDQSEFLL
ncbi:MAG: alpha-amylase family glycosyl hydrolase, partial [Bacteroidota bacterium]